jgi:hypothetical protein
VVPAGGLDITGVFVLATGASLLLQALKNKTLARTSITERRKAENEHQTEVFASLRLCLKTLSALFMVIVDCGTFI